MPKYFNLDKAAKSINKDYKYMQQHTPEMNQAISDRNQEPVYDPRQSVQDAYHDAEKKFGTSENANAKVFLWTEKQDVHKKTEKYEAFSHKDNQELQDYSARYTNHSARKRAGSSADAKAAYRKYNLKMQQLSEITEQLNSIEDINAPAALKNIKKFFKESMSALDLRGAAMKAAAEVKSTSKSDENFRKAKINRLILSQKIKLAEKYSARYTETPELAEYFQKQQDQLQDKMVLCLSDYESAYLNARGSVDQLTLEEIEPVQNEQIDVKNDTTSVNVQVHNITRRFGEPGSYQWKQKNFEHICKNSQLKSVRTALDEISHQHGDKYAQQLNMISDFGRSDTRIKTLKKHSSKGHSYSRNNETVFRFDLLGTGGAVNIKAASIPNRIQTFISLLNFEVLGGELGAERKEYLAWLKNVKHLESLADIDPYDDDLYYDAEFREAQYQFALKNKQLIADFLSYKIYGKNNEDPSLEHANRGIRVRQAERNVPENRRELREGQRRELISIQGCENMLGLGEFSIEAAAEHIKELAKVRLSEIFSSWQRGASHPHTIRFMLDGISRGGVNASLGAMSINGWVAEEYPQYLKYVKYDLIQREPVPGPTTATAKDSIRIGGTANGQELDKNGYIKGTKYRPLSKAATNSTVFYALHPDVGMGSPFFQPQRVYGANRIILSPFEHADDGAISGIFDKLLKSENKSRAMLNNSNGEFYAGSGVSDLDDGVYILDEYSTLTKINSYEDAVAILNKTRKDHIYSRRKARILEVVKDWFTEHSKEQENGR